MAVHLFEYRITAMSVETVASLSLLGAHHHSHYMPGLDTSGEISSQQTSDLEGPQDCNLGDPVHVEGGNMKGMASHLI
jgi:hypothetical protein